MVRTAELHLLLGGSPPLHHPQLPGSSGSLLRGSLAMATTGLALVELTASSRRTNAGLAR
jgi:hypothetical protein